MKANRDPSSLKNDCLMKLNDTMSHKYLQRLEPLHVGPWMMQFFQLFHVETQWHAMHVTSQGSVGCVDVAMGIDPKHGSVGVGLEVPMDSAHPNGVISAQSD